MTGRGFPREEYAQRIARAQALMATHGLDALMLTTEPEVRYFTGYLTRFWESPTRPWFLILPVTGQPIAVIPSIGEALMRASGVSDIRTWSSPNLEDDGISLVTDTLRDITPKRARIGVPDGHETHIRMPWSDFEAVRHSLSDRQIVGDHGIMRTLRMIKSPREVAKIRSACEIADRAFARVSGIACVGQPLSDVFRGFQGLCLEEGADWVPYLAGGAGQGGYSDVISPATDAPLSRGDVLMLDTGLVRDGYFSDFDRNWSIGPEPPDVTSAYTRLIDACGAGFAAAKPGATASDLYHAMARVLQEETEAGRLGHGLGMSLTEWPSLIATDHTVLEPGMVLTLEPGTRTASGIIVHEENIVITDFGAEYLSTPAPREIPVL